MFKSKIVKWGEHPAAPYNTPGFRFEKPKFWSCKNRDLEAESLRTTERFMGEIDDKARAQAKAYAASHANCKFKHLSWRGSITYFFPLTYKIGSIKFWYHGSGLEHIPMLQIRRRAKCEFCDKPACGWYSRKASPKERGRGLISHSYSACLDHLGRD